MLSTIRWILAAPFLLLGLVCLLYNWRLVVLYIRVRFFGRLHERESLVFLAGPILIFLGLRFAPVPDIEHYVLLYILVDPATYVFVRALPNLFR